MYLDSTIPCIKLNIYLFTTYTCTLLVYFYFLYGQGYLGIYK